MVERRIPKEKDICVAVLMELGNKSYKPDDLADKLRKKMRSPLSTTPVVSAALNFLGRKELVIKRRGKYKITDEGKRAIDIFFQNNPDHISLYPQ